MLLQGGTGVPPVQFTAGTAVPRFLILSALVAR